MRGNVLSFKPNFFLRKLRQFIDLAYKEGLSLGHVYLRELGEEDDYILSCPRICYSHSPSLDFYWFNQRCFYLFCGMI